MLSSLRRALRQAVTVTTALPLVLEGYNWPPAKAWARAALQDRQKWVKQRRQPGIQAARKQGFLTPVAARFLHDTHPPLPLISQRDYSFIQPVNGKYAKWLEDRVTTLAVLQPFAKHFETLLQHQTLRDGEPHVFSLGEPQGSGTSTTVPTFWKETTKSREGPTDGDRLFADKSLLLVHRPSTLFANAELDPVATVRVLLTNWNGTQPKAAEAYLESRKKISTQDAEKGGIPVGAPMTPGDHQFRKSQRIVTFSSPINTDTGTYARARAEVDYQLRQYDADPLNGAGFQGCILNWKEIKKLVEEIGNFIPHIEFAEFVFTPSARGPQIVSVSPHPAYGEVWPFTPPVVAGLQQKVTEKKASLSLNHEQEGPLLSRLKRALRRQFAKTFYPLGLVPYQSVRWLQDMGKDLRADTGVGWRDKLWAYRNGFLSYRLPQYGITPQTRKDHISDFEYRWLRHINSSYRKWLEDKVTLKYVAQDFSEFLPDYYYFTNSKDGGNHLVPMMDLPDGYGNAFSDVLALAREKQVLALKPDEGSHGSGFYRLDYQDGNYLLNGQIVEGEDVINVLSDPNNQYLVTEYIVQHPEIGRFYPTAVNTLRMTVFKPDGHTPKIGNAYLRIGSSASGYIDNTGAGGMIAEVDLDTGRIHSGGVLQEGKTSPMPRHPDTGELIEGQVPHWQFIKENILKIAESLQQLEFFGFDIAVTEEGFKLPEVNRFPDYPRISLLTPETNAYLLKKLAAKKALYGYDKRRPFKPITLPKR